MKNALLKILCALCLFASSNNAQNEKIRIDSIKVTGNNITAEDIIIRELTFAEGDFIDEALIDFNKERIYSLGLFNQVKLFTEKKDGNNFAIIEVKESWYIYPIPFITTQGHSFDRISYGMFLLYKNFRGRNETLTGKASFGYDPHYSLNYQNPSFLGRSDLSLTASVLNQTSSNKSDFLEAINGENFDYKLFSCFLMLGKRFNQFNWLYLISKYSYIKNPFVLPSISASGKKTDDYFSAGLIYQFDSRDLIQQATTGNYLNLEILHNGFGRDGISFNLFRIDARNYNNLTGKLVLKQRFLARNTFGQNVPHYYRSYFGYSFYVRGYKNIITEAYNSFLYSLELNYHLVKEWNFSIDLPLLPERLTTFRIGVVLKSFFDTGRAYNKLNDINFENLNAGYGVGINILFLPHNALRLDYAIDKFGKGEFLIGIGFPF